jgi:hypothetical protein
MAKVARRADLARERGDEEVDWRGHDSILTVVRLSRIVGPLAVH